MVFSARRLTRQSVVAIAIGMLVAGAPLIAFNFWLGSVIDRQSRDEADFSARQTAMLADKTTADVVRTLDSLSSTGVADCTVSTVEALQRATFAALQVKEISVLDGSGRPLCTPTAPSAAAESDATYRVLSTETLPGASGYVLDTVSLAGGAPMVRLRRPAEHGPNAVAALIASGAFLPPVVVHGFEPEGHVGADVGKDGDAVYAAIETRGNIALAGQGRRGETDEAYTATARSPKFGFKVTVMVPNSMFSTRTSELQWLGLFVTAIAVLLLGLFAVLVARRDPDNPVLEMEQALAAGEFVPYYQPIVDIATGQLRGAEVLVRWRKPDGTLVLPATFVPLAESSGLIRAMTLDLMRRVSDEVGKAIGERPGLKMSFNFASGLVGDAAMIQDVCSIFMRSPIKMTQVVLEITERDPIENLSATREVFSALQSLGVRIAIDDVGTGHSGLSYMLKLGVDIIKIDKIFIDSLGSDRNSTAIVETLVDLAHNMRLDVVAEGVENFEQVMHLREIGVRAAQGFVFAPPLPGSAFLTLVEAMDALGEASAPKADLAAQDRAGNEQAA